MSVRRLLAATALPVLLLVPTSARAGCVFASVCIGPTIEHPGQTTSPTEDSSGVLCEYLKFYAPPPSDWTGAPGSPPPYIFTRTQAWGDSPQHGQYADWDTRGCVIFCQPPHPGDAWNPWECVASPG